jgi:hypothetical protein
VIFSSHTIIGGFYPYKWGFRHLKCVNMQIINDNVEPYSIPPENSCSFSFSGEWLVFSVRHRSVRIFFQ